MLSVFSKTVPNEFSNSDLQKLDYLNAFIDETLRLNAPAANNGTRITPPEGVEIDGIRVPGEVAVLVAIHSSGNSAFLLYNY